MKKTNKIKKIVDIIFLGGYALLAIVMVFTSLLSTTETNETLMIASMFPMPLYMVTNALIIKYEKKKKGEKKHV